MTTIAAAAAAPASPTVGAAIMSQSDLSTTRPKSIHDSVQNNVGGAGHSADGVTASECETIIDNSQLKTATAAAAPTAPTGTTNGFHSNGYKNELQQQQLQQQHQTANAGFNPANYNGRNPSTDGKRKKLKSRSSTLPAADSSYMKEHLDAWLENCLKDASNPQLSSSSEFLDFNPASSFNKTQMLLKQKMLNQMQQQQHLASDQSFYYKNLNGNHGFPGFPKSNPQPNYPLGHNLFAKQKPSKLFKQQMQQMQQQSYLSGLNPTTAFDSNSYNGFGQGLQRMMPNYSTTAAPTAASAGSTVAATATATTTPPLFNNRFSFNFPSSGAYFPMTNDSQDFASLPPIVNIMGNTESPEHDINSADLLNGSRINPNSNQGFHFSDPCLLNPSDDEADSKLNDLKIDEKSKEYKDFENNRFFVALMEQINLLHETNSKICKNLHDTKVDIEALKHAPNWVGMRHRRDSLSGLSTQSQPMMFGGGFHSHSPAPTFHSGSYAPGMVGELVREVKDAARVREDALFNKVKTMVEERQWSLSESNLRIMRDIEDLKSQIRQLRSERKETNKRMSFLESENKYLKQMISTLFNSRHSTAFLPEKRNSYDRKTPSSHPNNNAKLSQSLNLHYGTVHHGENNSCVSLEEELVEGLNLNETNSSVSTADIATKAVLTENMDKRTSISSTDSSVSRNESVEQQTMKSKENNSNLGAIPSPPNFALVSSPEELTRIENLRKMPEKLKETLQCNGQRGAMKTMDKERLQKEISEAMAVKKEAERRVIALQNMVKSSVGFDQFSTINTGVGTTNKCPSSGRATKASAAAKPQQQQSPRSTKTTAPSTTLSKTINNNLHSIKPRINSSTTSSTLNNKVNNAKKLSHQTHASPHHSISVNAATKSFTPSSSAAATKSTSGHSPTKLSPSAPITDL